MKKSMKSIVAVGIGLSIVNGSIAPVLAIDNQKSSDTTSKQTISDDSNSIINRQVAFRDCSKFA